MAEYFPDLDRSEVPTPLAGPVQPPQKRSHPSTKAKVWEWQKRNLSSKHLPASSVRPRNVQHCRSEVKLFLEMLLAHNLELVTIHGQICMCSERCVDFPTRHFCEKCWADFKIHLGIMSRYIMEHCLQILANLENFFLFVTKGFFAPPPLKQHVAGVIYIIQSNATGVATNIVGHTSSSSASSANS